MTPVKATTAVAQTLTCNIGNVTQAVKVTWKDKDGNMIKTGQGGYTIEQGTVESSTKIQKSTLKIEPSVLSGLGSSVTYKCAAKSIQYSDSKISGDKDVVVNFLTFGMFLHFEL